MACTYAPCHVLPPFIYNTQRLKRMKMSRNSKRAFNGISWSHVSMQDGRGFTMPPEKTVTPDSATQLSGVQEYSTEFPARLSVVWQTETTASCTLG